MRARSSAVPSVLSGLIALVVCLPIVVLLGLAAHFLDDEEEPCAMPERRPARNTWTRERIEA